MTGQLIPRSSMPVMHPARLTRPTPARAGNRIPFSFLATWVLIGWAPLHLWMQAQLIIMRGQLIIQVITPSIIIARRFANQSKEFMAMSKVDYGNDPAPPFLPASSCNLLQTISRIFSDTILIFPAPFSHRSHRWNAHSVHALHGSRLSSRSYHRLQRGGGLSSLRPARCEHSELFSRRWPRRALASSRGVLDLSRRRHGGQAARARRAGRG